METSGKRDDIIKAALELFAEQGFHGTPMSMIAEKAGVGAGTIYRYFENKNVLITELFGELERKYIAALQDGYDPNKPIKERLFHIGKAMVVYSISNPLYFRYTEQFYNSPYGVSRRKDKMLGKAGDHDLLEEIFDEGVSQQIFKDLPRPVLFAFFIGPLITIIRDHILDFYILDEGLIQEIVNACWDGIKQ